MRLIPIPCIPHRYLIVVESFIVLTLGYINRFCLSITLPEMLDLQKTETRDDSCHFGKHEIEEEPLKEYEFKWLPTEISLVQSSFFWGYSIALVPAGVLADATGGKLPVVFGLVLTGCVSGAMPPVTRFGGVYCLVALRFVLGLFQALCYAGLHSTFAAWIPQYERSLLGVIIFAGIYIGNALNFSLSGLYLNADRNAWAYLHFIYGSIAIFWSIVFFATTYNTPESHPNLNENELALLTEYAESVQREKKGVTRTPWTDLLSNDAVWSIMIGMFGHGWGFFLMMTSLPSFMSSVLNLNIRHNGLYNALTNLLIWTIAIISGIFCDMISKRKIISLTVSRKIGTTIGSLLPSIGLLASVYTNCNRELALAVIIVGNAFMGFYYSSLHVNAVDLAPNYAATIASLGNSASAIAGLLVGLLVPSVTPRGSLDEWRWVMLVGFTVMTVTNIYYLLFGSAEIQPFNRSKLQKMTLTTASTDFAK